MIPRLVKVFPNVHLPTVIRSSSLSILATCAETDWRALVPWSNDLVKSCLDLIRVESVTDTGHEHGNRSRQTEGDEKDHQIGREAITVQAQDPKHPALRRSALVFLGLLFDALSKAVDESLVGHQPTSTTAASSIRLANPSIDSRPSASSNDSTHRMIDPHLVQAATTLLDHVKFTDTDSLASYQAGEVLDILRRLQARLY